MCVVAAVPPQTHHYQSSSWQCTVKPNTRSISTSPIPVRSTASQIPFYKNVPLFKNNVFVNVCILRCPNQPSAPHRAECTPSAPWRAPLLEGQYCSREMVSAMESSTGTQVWLQPQVVPTDHQPQPDPSSEERELSGVQQNQANLPGKKGSQHLSLRAVLGFPNWAFCCQ